MNTTTNYDLKLYEGTDLFNPLTVENVNFSDLDSVIKAIADNAVGNATELKTATVHALNRATGQTDCDTFVFIATSNYTAGDTFTLDGQQVSALTVAGSQLSTGAYVIGSSVLVHVHDTLLTFFVSETTAQDAERLGGELPSYYAQASALSDVIDDVTALATKVGTAVLTTTAQDCSGAINEINGNLSQLDMSLKNISYTGVQGWTPQTIVAKHRGNIAAIRAQTNVSIISADANVWHHCLTLNECKPFTNIYIEPYDGSTGEPSTVFTAYIDTDGKMNIRCTTPGTYIMVFEGTWLVG